MMSTTERLAGFGKEGLYLDAPVAQRRLAASRKTRFYAFSDPFRNALTHGLQSAFGINRGPGAHDEPQMLTLVAGRGARPMYSAGRTGISRDRSMALNVVRALNSERSANLARFTGEEVARVVMVAISTADRAAREARASVLANDQPRNTGLYEASTALRRAALTGDPALVAEAAAMLHRAAHIEIDRRPRHAAVALAAWDALSCTENPLETPAQRRVLLEVAQLLVRQFISTDLEMALLDKMDAAGLERVPPFEDTLVGEVFGLADGDGVR